MPVDTDAYVHIRPVQLPDNADLSRIAARFDNGVLTVTVKKDQATAVDVQDIPIGGF